METATTARTLTRPAAGWRWLTSESARWLTVPLGAFLFTRLLVFAAILFADAFLPGFNDSWAFTSGNVAADYVQAWNRWDSVWYVDVVENGYVYSVDNPRSTVAFFPLYPLVVRALLPLAGGNVALSGLLVSNACFLAALILLYRFVRLKLGDDGTAGRTVIYLAAFPLSFFFSGIYTESLFLLLTLSAFYTAERRAWSWAALAGLLASGTRVTGVLVWGAVTLLWLETHGWQLATVLQRAGWQRLARALRTDGKTFLLLCLMPLGLVAYMVSLQATFGEPLAFSKAVSGWRQPPGIQAFLNDVDLLLKGQLWPSYIMDLAASLIVLALVPVMWRRLGAAYALYCLLAVLIPISTGVMSFTRYGMVLFPVFMLLGRWGRHRPVDIALRATWLVLLPLFTLLFVKWVFMG